MNSLWYSENNISPDDSIGIDEVGRGPLAGPVVAAAVWIDEACVALIERDGVPVRDSKKLTSKQREKIVHWFSDQPEEHFRFAIEQATEQEIDSMNILNATMLAMQRAYKTLELHKSIVLVDGNHAPDLPDTTVKTVIKGDDCVLSIALASIIAKEYRDSLMRNLSEKYPQYGWDTNVGYGSQKHLCAILRYGATPYHRMTFAPVKDLNKAAEEISKSIKTMEKK